MHVHVFSPDGEAKFWLEPASVSQGSLRLWLGQAIDFVAGRQSCALVVRVSCCKSKPLLQARWLRICRRPGCSRPSLT